MMTISTHVQALHNRKMKFDVNPFFPSLNIGFNTNLETSIAGVFLHLKCCNNTWKASKYFMFAEIKVGKMKNWKENIQQMAEIFRSMIFLIMCRKKKAKNQFMKSAIKSEERNYKKKLKANFPETSLWSEKRAIRVWWTRKFISKLKLLQQKSFFN